MTPEEQYRAKLDEIPAAALTAQGRSIEQQLGIVKGLAARGLIPDEIYQARTQPILETL